MFWTELEETGAKSMALTAAVNEIPKAHRDTLQFLVFHLSRVIQHASDNLVSRIKYVRLTVINIYIDDSTKSCRCLRPDHYAAYGYSTRAHRRSATTCCCSGTPRKL